MRDVYISPNFSGPQLGTKDNPFSAGDSFGFDSLMQAQAKEMNHVLLKDGNYKTRAVGEWNRRTDRGFLLDAVVESESGNADNVIVERDLEHVANEDIDDEPTYLFSGVGVYDTMGSIEFSTLSPKDVFDRLPRGQAVKNLTVVCHHSKLTDRYHALGHAQRTGAVALNGHNAAIENVKVVDAGAYRHPDRPNQGAEVFPLTILGATGAPDCTELVKLDPTKYKLDDYGEPSHITGTEFLGYVPETTNDQVTVRMITGVIGERNGWNHGDWGFMWRRDCYQENNKTTATGKNLVQAHTNYLAEKGRIRHNQVDGVDVCVYHDYVQTKGQLIELNTGSCRTGVAIYLSPGPPVDLASLFFHEDYTIGLNGWKASGNDVDIWTLDHEWAEECAKAGRSPTDSIRHISGMKVHASLRLHQLGGEPAVRFGEDLNKKKGCRFL